MSARRKEMAVRAAVGAGPGRLLRLVLGEGTLLLLVGLALGAGVAVGSGRLLQNLLFQVEPANARTLLAAGAVLLLVGLGAALIPARSAMRSDPSTLLRAD